ncbi:hypothetical protein H3V53_13870 [Paraburkholderia bengalensis]|uniref:Uncharacterized protein n=1 Tax=Paraburkholderia bengalensis TaxID=2747562 RepID=A0ABU8IRK5_9BURK
MQVFANLPLKRMATVRGNRQSTYHGGWFNAVRLIGPERESRDRSTRGRSYIMVDVEVPEDLKEYVAGPFQSDGTLRVQIFTGPYFKTFRAFLESGDLEWDVRGQ